LFGSPSSFLLGAKSKGWGMNQQISIAIDAQTRGYEATYVGILITKYGEMKTLHHSYRMIRNIWGAYQF